MKKISIIFLSLIVLSLSLVFPSFAVMTDSFGSYTNLFDPSDVVQARFYTSSSEYQNNNFYSVYLDENKTYTFISTEGSKSFYVGSSSLYDNFTSVFSYRSSNLLDEDSLISPNFIKLSNGSYLLSKTSSTDRFSSLVELNLPHSSYCFSLSYLYIEASVYGYYLNNNNELIYFVFDGTNNNTIYINDSIVSIRLYIDSSAPDGVTANVINLMLNEGSSPLPYVPYYSDPIFNDGLTYIYTFSPSSSGTFYIGINDILSGSTTNQFSYNQSSENEFYLVEGSFTPDQIADVLQQDRYNQGYTQGYKEGEYDGLNSTKFMNSTILTSLSAPFVILSSGLNFEIFGINFYHILQVLFTLLLVAFVVTKLKGRE